MSRKTKQLLGVGGAGAGGRGGDASSLTSGFSLWWRVSMPPSPSAVSNLAL